MDDASGRQPDGDEDGDELGKPDKDFLDEKVAFFWFVTPWVSP